MNIIIIIIIIIIFSDNKIICMSNKMEHNTQIKFIKNGFIVKTTIQNLHVVWYPVLWEEEQGTQTPILEKDTLEQMPTLPVEEKIVKFDLHVTFEKGQFSTNTVYVNKKSPYSNSN